MRVRLAMCVFLFAAVSACGESEETELETDSGTDESLEADTNEEADSDTDSEAVVDSQEACVACEEQFASSIGQCANPCVNEPNFCQQQVCRYRCEADYASDLAGCFGGLDECADRADSWSCNATCRATWESCVGDSICPGGPGGNCETAMIACLDTCE